MQLALNTQYNQEQFSVPNRTPKEDVWPPISSSIASSSSSCEEVLEVTVWKKHSIFGPPGIDFE